MGMLQSALAVAVLAAGSGAGFAAWAADPDDLDPGAKLQLAESHVTATLAPTHARRLFVLDTAFPAAEAAKTYVLDGATGRIEGMFNQAYWPNFAVSPDGSELYAVDTYFEKHTRGKRSDYIVVRDARTLAVKDDIPLPGGRLLQAAMGLLVVAAEDRARNGEDLEALSKRIAEYEAWSGRSAGR